ncbi:hypothetical protein AAMO2058_000917000 [Amorphochlora amoebiformis]
MEQALQLDRSELRHQLDASKDQRMNKHLAAEQSARESHQEHLEAMRIRIEKESLSEIEKRDKLLQIERKSKADLDVQLQRLQSKLRMALEVDKKEATVQDYALSLKYRELSSLVETLHQDKASLETKLRELTRNSETASLEAQRTSDGLRFENEHLRQKLSNKTSAVESLKQVLLEAFAMFRKHCAVEDAVGETEKRLEEAHTALDLKMKTAILHERERISREYEAKQQSLIDDQKAAEDRARQISLEQLSALRAEIEEEKIDAITKREKLVAIEKSSKQELERKLQRMREQFKGALDMEQKDAQRKQADADKRHAETSRDMSKILREKSELQAKLGALVKSSEKRIADAEKEITTLRLELRNVRIELKSHKKQIEQGEEVKQGVLLAEKAIQKQQEEKFKQSLRIMQTEREQYLKDHERAKAKHIQDHRIAEQAAKDSYQTKLKVIRSEIESEKLSEIAKRDKLLDAGRKAKYDLDDELQKLNSLMQKSISREDEAVVAKENEVEAKYRSAISDLVSQLEESNKERAALRAQVKASVERSKVAAAESKREVKSLRDEVKNMKDQVDAARREREHSIKVEQEQLRNSNEIEEEFKKSFDHKVQSDPNLKRWNKTVLITQHLQMRESLEIQRAELRKSLEEAKTRYLQDHREAEADAQQNHQKRLAMMCARVEKEKISEFAKRDKLIEIEREANADLNAQLRQLQSKLRRAVEIEETVGMSKEEALESQYTEFSSLVKSLRREKADLEAKLSASKAMEMQALEARKNADKLAFDVDQLRQRLADKNRETEIANKVLHAAIQDTISQSHKREEQLVQDLQRKVKNIVVSKMPIRKLKFHFMQLKHELRTAISQGDEKASKLAEERLDEAVSHITKEMTREKVALESKLQASLKSFEIRSAKSDKERDILQVEVSHLKAQLLEHKRQTGRAKEAENEAIAYAQKVQEETKASLERQMKSSILRERKMLEAELETKRQQCLDDHKAAQDRAKERHRQQLAAVRAKIQTEKMSDAAKRDKLLAAEMSTEQKLNSELKQLEIDKENALKIEENNAKQREADAEKKYSDISKTMETMLREKTQLEAKVRAIAAVAEARAAETEKEIGCLRVQLRQTQVDSMSQKRQLQQAEKV